MVRPRVACVVGARPNFVKIAPVLAGLASEAPDVEVALVHTGQHYDAAMSERFFAELAIPEPDVHLEVGSGSHGEQTARVLERFEGWLLAGEPRPAAVVVVGDVNSTLAAALAAVKLGIPVVHVEAGLRSFDRSMPEEINRVVVDAVADLLLCSEPSGVENLRREGRPESAIRLVGNVMIDVLAARLPAARASDAVARRGLAPGGFVLWTVHRPATVDEPAVLAAMVETLVAVAAEWPVVLPLHPRTRARLEAGGASTRLEAVPRLHLEPPLGYLDFLALQAAAGAVVTDSGGVQEETTVLGVPCFTLRPSTERPITVDEGSNILVGHDFARLRELLAVALAGGGKRGRRPALWDGRAGGRVAREVLRLLDGR